MDLSTPDAIEDIIGLGDHEDPDDPDVKGGSDHADDADDPEEWDEWCGQEGEGGEEEVQDNPDAALSADDLCPTDGVDAIEKVTGLGDHDNPDDADATGDKSGDGGDGLVDDPEERAEMTECNDGEGGGGALKTNDGVGGAVPVEPKDGEHGKPGKVEPAVKKEHGNPCKVEPAVQEEHANPRKVEPAVKDEHGNHGNPCKVEPVVKEEILDVLDEVREQYDHDEGAVKSEMSENGADELDGAIDDYYDEHALAVSAADGADVMLPSLVHANNDQNHRE